MNAVAQFFVDLGARLDDHATIDRIDDVVERCAADDAVTKRFDLFTITNNSLGPDAAERAAILFGYDNVLCDVNQTACQVTRVSRFQSRIGETLTGTVRRDEVLENVQSLAEVSENRILDDLARRLGHQASHTGELTDLSFRTTSTGIGHHQDRVEFVAFLLTLVHREEHFLCDVIGHVGPDGRYLIGTFHVGHGRIFVLLAKLFDLDQCLLDDALLRRRRNHVVDTDRNAGLRRVEEAHCFQIVEQRDRVVVSETQMAKCY